MAEKTNIWPEKSSSIKFEFSLWVILLLLLTTATLTASLLRLQREALKKEVTRRGVALAQYVGAHSIDPFLTHDELSLATLVADVMKNEDMVYGQIVDRNGKLVAADHSEQVGQVYARPAGSYPLDRPEPNIYYWVHAQAGPVIDIGIPLILQGKTKIGEVHLGISQSSIQKVVGQAWTSAASLASLFLLAGLIGSVLLVTWMLRPISTLTEGAKAIGSGNFDYQIPVTRRNELGQLAQTFNTMASELKQATEQALEQERIKKELQVAAQIQQMLLPKSDPQVAGLSVASYYRAAKEIGGDYYDFFPVGEHGLGVTVADVCGKGVPAALLMSVARSILKSVAPENASPLAVVRELNRLLLGDLRAGLFITLFYATLDVKKRVLAYTSAGHTPGLLWRAASEEFVNLTLEPACLPLGLYGSETLFTKLLKEKKVDLQKQDIVVLYTDGVTEAMNAQREGFGQDRLMESIKRCAEASTAKRIVERVEADVNRFCGDFPQSDDIALVVMKLE